MRSSKNRSRNKNNNRNRSVGNVVNRVFDSSGPEGKVRGTPQQIIDKYLQLTRDSQLGNDRVAAENFQQHAEHYTRMLGEAMREQESRREAQEAANRDRQREQRENQQNNQQNEQPRAAADPASMPQPDANVVDLGGDTGSGLVETPESLPVEEKPKQRRQRRPRQDKKPTDAQPEPVAEAAPQGDAAE